MPNVLMFINLKLVKEKSIRDFFLAARKFNNEYMSKQKGYVSWDQLVEGEACCNIFHWETMDDAKKVLGSNTPTSLAENFYTFIDPESCKVSLFDDNRLLVFSGPLKGFPGIDGTVVIKAKIWEDAETIFKSEPFVAEGYTTYKI